MADPAGVAVIFAAIIASIVYPLWKRHAFILATIVTILIAFIVQTITDRSAASSVTLDLAFQPVDLWNGEGYSIVSSMYLHGGTMHVLFNVLALIMLANPFERRIGTIPMMALYLLSGLIATLFFAAFVLLAWYAYGTTFFGSPSVLLLGASGAFNGVLGAYARLYPRERVSFFIYFLPMPPLPMMYWAFIFLALETLFVMVPQCGIAFYGGAAANLAHIGGMLGGMLLAPYVTRLPTGPIIEARPVDFRALGQIARTPSDLRILDQVRFADRPELQLAWAERLVERGSCPRCQRPLHATRRGGFCSCGFRLRY